MDTTESPAPGDPLVAFYVGALRLLERSRIPFLVGGTFAYARYTGIDRDTKDLDVFVRPGDVARTLAAFEAAGYGATLPYPHWLGKIRRGSFVLDVMFASGNGVAQVDDLWFDHAAQADVFGIPVRLCPAEEMIWSKAFVQERERFDGADVVHLFKERGPSLDWERLLARFGEHWPVLLSHLVLFLFVYPDQRECVPADVVRELTRRVGDLRQDTASRVCFGTLLSREQYLHDIAQLGYQDARVRPLGTMTRAQTDTWTAAISRKE